jgi:nitrous oxide reductase accessory protein NosL
MGRELIPLGKESDAKVFMKDHKGAKVMTFPEVTADIVRRLD